MKKFYKSRTFVAFFMYLIFTFFWLFLCYKIISDTNQKVFNLILISKEIPSYYSSLVNALGIVNILTGFGTVGAGFIIGHKVNHAAYNWKQNSTEEDQSEDK